MEVPECIVGLTRDVKRCVGRSVTALKRGASFAEAFTATMLDSSALPGLLVLDGPSPLLGDADHAHLYLVPRLLWEATGSRAARLPIARRGELFDALLEHSWSTLSLLGGSASLPWLLASDRHVPFLRAVLGHGPEFPVSAIYSQGSRTGAPLWMLASNVKYVLVNLGAPEALVREAADFTSLETLAQAVLPRR